MLETGGSPSHCERAGCSNQEDGSPRLLRSKMMKLVGLLTRSIFGAKEDAEHLAGHPDTPQKFDVALDQFQTGDVTAAIVGLIALARDGDADAQYDLGWRYFCGDGVPKSYSEAVKWYRLAAEQGHAKAQFHLGDRHYWGIGVDKNRAEAAEWYRLAAEQGYADAQYELGQMYERGRGVPQNSPEAVRWYQLAAEQDDDRAQYKLGDMHVNGGGIPRNDAAAVKWWSLLAKQGHARAQALLGLMYGSGRGVPKDLVKAYAWSIVASAQDPTFPDYQEVKESLVELMTAAQIAEAQMLSQEYWDLHVLPTDSDSTFIE